MARVAVTLALDIFDVQADRQIHWRAGAHVTLSCHVQLQDFLDQIATLRDARYQAANVSLYCCRFDTRRGVNLHNRGVGLHDVDARDFVALPPQEVTQSSQPRLHRKGLLFVTVVHCCTCQRFRVRRTLVDQFDGQSEKARILRRRKPFPFLTRLARDQVPQESLRRRAYVNHWRRYILCPRVTSTEAATWCCDCKRYGGCCPYGFENGWTGTIRERSQTVRRVLPARVCIR